MDVTGILKKEEIKNLLDSFEANIKEMFKGRSVKLQLTLKKSDNDIFYKLRDQWNYQQYPENYIIF